MEQHIEDLRETFEMMKESSVDGHLGALKVTSKNGEHPNVGISIMTHGNEPSGLAAVQHFLENNRLQKLLNQGPGGSVVFLLNNINAASRYFSLPDTATEVEKDACRFSDHNMNRLPDEILSMLGQTQRDSRYEVQRTLELYPLLKKLDAGLDIHSIRTDAFQMRIEVKGDGLFHGRNFPLNTTLSNMIPVQSGVPISALYGGKDGNAIPVVGIEAGKHEDAAACTYAIECTRSFLMSLGVIPSDSSQLTPVETLEYKVSKGVIPQDDGSHMAKNFVMFEVVKPDTIVLLDKQQQPIRAGMHGHILFPQPANFTLRSTEEACFISEPVKTTLRMQDIPIADS